MAYLQVRPCSSPSLVLSTLRRADAVSTSQRSQGMSPYEIPKVELRRGDIVQVTPSACASSPSPLHDALELPPLRERRAQPEDAHP